MQVLFSTLIYSILLSFLIAFPIIHLLYKFSLTRRSDVDFSNLIESREKKVGTPIMGGLVVIFTVMILNIIINRNNQPEIQSSLDVLLIVFAILAFLGGLDDILNIYGKERKIKRISRVLKLIRVHKNKIKRLLYILLLPWLLFKRLFHILGSNPGKGIQAHEKIIIQTIVGIILAFFACYTNQGEDPFSVWVPMLGWVTIGILMVPFIIFSILAVSNAVNLTDGMDGLVAGLLITAFSGLLVISLQQNNNAISILLITVIGSLITYLYFNIPPARFQMGDVGSLSLGGLLVSIAFVLRVPLLIPIIGFPFVAEVSSSIIQAFSRRIFGKRILKMAPLHHHFEMSGWSEEKVVMRFWIAGLVFTIFGLWLYFMFY